MKTITKFSGKIHRSLSKKQTENNKPFKEYSIKFMNKKVTGRRLITDITARG